MLIVTAVAGFKPKCINIIKTHAMKLTEKILALITICSIAGSIFLIPGTGVLLMLSSLCLLILYFYFSFALFNNIRLRKIFKSESYQDVSRQRITGAIGAGLAISAGLCGILFKLQSWPGASFNLYAGIITLFIVSLVALVKYRRNKSQFYEKILVRTTVVFIVVFTLVMLPKDALLDFKYRNHPGYLNAVKEARLNPLNEELLNRLIEEREKMYEEQVK